MMKRWRCILACAVLGSPPSSEPRADAAIQLSQPTGRAVFQRNAQNRADLPIVGTYSGGVTQIEARAIVMSGGNSGVATPWQVIDASPIDGTFAGRLRDVAAGGWYQIEVRSLDGADPVDVAAIERIGVGEVFLTAGQSNSANHGAPRQIAEDRVSANRSQLSRSWRQGHDPQPIATGSGGSPWPGLGNLLVDAYDMPVGFLSVGVGGTRVDEWLPGTFNYIRRLQPALRLLGPNGFRAVLWHQGESDSINNTSTEIYAARLESIIAQSRIDAGFDVPWGVALASYHPDSSASNEALVVAGQQQVIANDPLVFEGAFTDDFHVNGWLSDTVHFNQRGLDEHAARWATAIQQFLVPEPGSVPLGAFGVVLLLSRNWRRRTS